MSAGLQFQSRRLQMASPSTPSSLNIAARKAGTGALESRRGWALGISELA